MSCRHPRSFTDPGGTVVCASCGLTLVEIKACTFHSPSSSKWDLRFLALAREVAGWSKDPGTKVGAIYVRDRRVMATGYCGPPTGVDDADPRVFSREEKWLWSAHAEVNGIYYAARVGTSLFGSGLFVTHHPCAQCAGALVQVGVERIVLGGPATWASTPEKRRSLEVAKLILAANRIEVDASYVDR